MPEKLKFEEAMQRLTRIVETLEEGSEPLEKAMALFEEGTALSAQCYRTLDEAEQKIRELTAEEASDEAE